MKYVVAHYSECFGGKKYWIVEKHAHFNSLKAARNFADGLCGTVNVLTTELAKKAGYCFVK